MTERFEMRASTMLDLLAQRTAEHPDRVAYTFLDDQSNECNITFEELDRRARAIASRCAPSRCLNAEPSRS